VVLQNCLYLQKYVAGSNSQECGTPHNGHQAVCIKVEEFSHMEVVDDPPLMTCVEIKVENEVSLVCVCACV
jgi:hypothetical protein